MDRWKADLDRWLTTEPDWMQEGLDDERCDPECPPAAHCSRCNNTPEGPEPEWCQRCNGSGFVESVCCRAWDVMGTHSGGCSRRGFHDSKCEECKGSGRIERLEI